MHDDVDADMCVREREGPGIDCGLRWRAEKSINHQQINSVGTCICLGYEKGFMNRKMLVSIQTIVSLIVYIPITFVFSSVNSNIMVKDYKHLVVIFIFRCN